MSAERRFGSGLGEGSDPVEAAREAADAAAEGLAGASADLVVVFATPALAREQAVLDEIHGRLSPAHLIGCSTETVMAGARELENQTAIAVWAASLPDAELLSFELRAHPLAGGIGVGGWPDEVGPRPGSPWTVILLADPFSFPTDGLLARVNEESERPPVILGGLASGGHRRGEHRLLFGDRSMSEGAVAVAVAGITVVPVVSQGCAPIGPEMVITAAENSAVRELASTPALEKIEDVMRSLTDDERAVAASGLLAGLVIDENRPEYERGDFLIRAIHGGDPHSGELRVGERVRVGQTMRLHVRDADSAGEDLRQALAKSRPTLQDATAGGALVFTCNGRGARMFGIADHDAAAVAAELGAPPTAGMYCNGEIGPVGGHNFLHGFTATIALFGR